MMRSKRWAGFRSVLCPIDFSEHSQRALRYAEAIALRGKAVLRVVYVNDPLLIAAAAAALHDLEFAERSGHELQEFINATIAPGSRTQLRVKAHVAIGNPPDEILKAANRSRTDLIVLGTHGVSGADRLLIGSTTLSVLQHTTVPVLAVPGAGAHLVTSPSRSWPGERIVAALELDSGAGKDVDVAAHLAGWFGSSLLLVHVVSDIAAPAWLKADLSAHDRIRVASARQQLDVLAAQSQKHVATDARVVCGRVADEIAAVAATERTGLLITALRDRRGWFGARRGSISYHVLSHAVTPVLAYPPQWRPQ
jgi:nucleotide-binding universal stress UspA family protein